MGSSAGDWLNGEASTMEYPGGMKADERECQVPNQVNVNPISGLRKEKRKDGGCPGGCGDEG